MAKGLGRRHSQTTYAAKLHWNAAKRSRVVDTRIVAPCRLKRLPRFCGPNYSKIPQPIRWLGPGFPMLSAEPDRQLLSKKQQNVTGYDSGDDGRGERAWLWYVVQAGAWKCRTGKWRTKSQEWKEKRQRINTEKHSNLQDYKVYNFFNALPLFDRSVSCTISGM